MKILYGTGNKAKAEQMKKILLVNSFDYDVMNLKDIGFDQDIVEDGKTFEENSMIKAKAIRKFCDEKNINDIVIITDDAGLCVNALNGEPGVYSARYAGDHAPQDVTLNKLMDNMKEYETEEERSAMFVCVLTASLPNGEYLVCRGEALGHVANNIGTLGGLTYEPIFVPKGFNKPMSEMSLEEFAMVKNHRDLAMVEMIDKLRKLGY